MTIVYSPHDNSICPPFLVANSDENSVYKEKAWIHEIISTKSFPVSVKSLSSSVHKQTLLGSMAKQFIGANGCNDQRPHFVLVPFMAQGHTIPMIDMAFLIARRGALVSFITTPVNAARIRPVIDQVQAAGIPIRFIELKFPWAEAGLPEGCENMDLIPMELHRSFLNAIKLLRQPLELYLRKVEPSPSCIITDYSNYFTAEVARELNIPRFIFHAVSGLAILCMHNVFEHKPYDGVHHELEPVVIPNLPWRIELGRAQALSWFPGPEFEDFRNKVLEAEAAADGVVINTFYELEADTVEYYKKAIGKPVWPFGPLALCNKDFTGKAVRGKESSIDEQRVSSWLDSKEPKSVLYLNFGSLVQLKPKQLIEIGCAFEASNRPFIWVIKESEKCTEIDKFLSDGFEERTKDRGLVITGWAPQLLILSHPSIAGYVTHCGWNSTLEAVCQGVPMITWPHFSDHFISEKLIVQVLKVGVSAGANLLFYYTRDGVVVTREELEKAIVSLMDEGEQGSERRKRVAEIAEKARKAMEEGGSSYENLNLFIENFRENSN